MKKLKISLLLCSVLFTFHSIFAQGGNNRVISNSIEGTVFDENRQPVFNAFVELYNNLGVMIGNLRTTSAGRFSFRRLGPGRYSVTVKPLMTNLLEETQVVEINNQFGLSETAFVDFRLGLDRRFLPSTPTVTGAVFVQDVPENAKRLFRSGIEKLESDHVRAIQDLEQAVAVFPEYFDCLAALGKTHILDGNYEKGYPYLLKAIDVNQKCADCYYSLGLAFFKLDQIPAAVTAIDAAAFLHPQGFSVRLLQGIILLAAKDVKGAETALLAAKSLSKNPNPDVHYNLGLVYNKQGRNQEAADQLELYLKADKKIPDLKKEETKELIRKLRKSKNG
jgi:tetratricopeptide (TPR) repeat protein